MPGRHVVVIRPDCHLADGQGAFVLGPGAGVVPLAVEHTAEIVVEVAHVRMVRPEGGFADGQGTLMVGAGICQVAKGP